MAVNAWPSSLGSPSVDGFRFSRPDYMERLETWRGAPRYRRVVNAVMEDLDLQFWFSATQLQTFEVFYWETLNAGTNDCQMNIITYFGALPVLMILYPYRARFDSVMQASQVTFSAKYRPPPLSLLSVLV